MQGGQRSLHWYRCQGYGPRQSECPTKVSIGKDQRSSMPVGQSNKKKTRAMVARSNEDGEKACTCVNVEKPRSSRNIKKSNSNRLTSDDEAIYSAACRAQSNDEVDKLNGRPVKVLRDTGCTGMIVDRALIPDSMMIPGSSGSLQMVDHTLISQCLSGFPVLQTDIAKLCVSAHPCTLW